MRKMTTKKTEVMVEIDSPVIHMAERYRLNKCSRHTINREPNSLAGRTHILGQMDAASLSLVRCGT